MTADLNMVASSQIQKSLAIECDLRINGNSFILADSNVQQNKEPLQNALEQLSNLSAYKFDVNGTQDFIGLAANELRNTLPEAIMVVSGSNYLSYNSVVTVLVEAVKTLNTNLNTLQTNFTNYINTHP